MVSSHSANTWNGNGRCKDTKQGVESPSESAISLPNVLGFPAGSSGFLGDHTALARGERFGSGLAAFESTKATGFNCGKDLFRLRGRQLRIPSLSASRLKLS